MSLAKNKIKERERPKDQSETKPPGKPKRSVHDLSTPGGGGAGGRGEGGGEVRDTRQSMWGEGVMSAGWWRGRG